MKKIVISGFMLFILLFLPCFTIVGESFEINTVLMRSTFKIEGKDSLGTCFIVAKPSQKDETFSFYVLVTADHVLSEIKGDKATIYLRKRVGDTFEKFPHSINIRENGRPLWTKHPEEDIAAMYISLPVGVDISLLGTTMFANDDIFNEYEIHPGDELFCLGFPLGFESNDAGFPVLRGGKISTFPLVPMKKVRRFLFDFEVFPGNSGGPVYFVAINRYYGSTFHLGGGVQCLVGLVIQQANLKEKSLFRDELHPLGLGVVIQSAYIKETIDMLPPR